MACRKKFTKIFTYRQGGCLSNPCLDGVDFAYAQTRSFLSLIQSFAYQKTRNFFVQVLILLPFRKDRVNLKVES